LVEQPSEVPEAKWRSATQTAVDVPNTSMDYYTRLAKRAKVFYFGSESLLLVAGTSIPVTAAFTSSRAVPAVPELSSNGARTSLGSLPHAAN
jgi:hypothetical protein